MMARYRPQARLSAVGHEEEAQDHEQQPGAQPRPASASDTGTGICETSTFM